MRALIVDDDAEVSGMFCRALASWGWETDQCASVSGALALARGGHYDLALCDVNLPDGDGLFLARALAQARPSLRVVMASGNPANLDKAHAAGFTRCLRKPFDLDALKALLGPLDAPNAGRFDALR